MALIILAALLSACMCDPLSFSGSRFCKLLLTTLCVCVCVCVKVTQLCLTLCNPIDCSPPCSSVHGILWTGILEWVAFPFSRVPTQELNPGLLHCRWIIYHLSHQGSPVLTTKIWQKGGDVAGVIKVLNKFILS